MSILERRRFEAWVRTTRVWKKYTGTTKACSLRTHMNGHYADFRINDRWLAWLAAVEDVKSRKEENDEQA